MRSCGDSPIWWSTLATFPKRLGFSTRTLPNRSHIPTRQSLLPLDAGHPPILLCLTFYSLYQRDEFEIRTDFVLGPATNSFTSNYIIRDGLNLAKQLGRTIKFWMGLRTPHESERPVSRKISSRAFSQRTMTSTQYDLLRSHKVCPELNLDLTAAGREQLLKTTS